MRGVRKKKGKSLEKERKKKGEETAKRSTAHLQRPLPQHGLALLFSA
jgi:hypothetical protein